MAMSASPTPHEVSAQPVASRAPNPWAAVSALGRTTAFTLTMSPARRNPVRALTREPIVERVPITGVDGSGVAEIYRPGTPGRHPGVVASLGVLPRGVTDPRVAMLGEAFARAGFVVLLHWSPACRDLRMDPADVQPLVDDIDMFLARRDVDPGRSGLFGVCVGGSLSLIAAAIRASGIASRSSRLTRHMRRSGRLPWTSRASR